MKNSRLIRSLSNKENGFTLIEVMVALLIIASVLTSTYTAIINFSEQRQRVQERFIGQSIAWNELMMRYQINNNWQDSAVNKVEENGVLSNFGVNWFWQLDRQAALGEGVFKLTMNVYRYDQVDHINLMPTASLVMFETLSVIDVNQVENK